MSGTGAAPFAPVGRADGCTSVPQAIEQDILRFVVRTYPNGSSHHEPAIRLSLQLGWAARHHRRDHDEEQL